jgi:serine/threonine-protein kinase
MVEQKPWVANWIEDATDKLRRRIGGQGIVKLVRRRDGQEASLFVLKELKQQKSKERRARMYREVVALETLPHSSTPGVIEHNTNSYRDLSVNLYAVFEFIDGQTLAEYVSEKGQLFLDDALHVVIGIIDVLEAFHKTGVGHRDIKPDNIILLNNSCSSPVLIDFGMSFNIEDDEAELTPNSQQVGNRFLSLPEHAMFSENKRDLRSDLTSCVGLLYFMLTGTWPCTLIDESGRPPHQRAEQRKLLDKLPDYQRHNLLHAFDQGFDPNLARRWQTAAALRAQLERLAVGEPEGSATDLAVSRLRERAAGFKGNKLIIQALDDVRNRLEHAALDAVGRLGDGYDPSIEKRGTSMSNMDTWIRCGVHSVYEGRMIDTPFLVRAVGEEVIVQQQFHDHQKVRARIPIANPQAIPELHEIIISIIIENVNQGMIY